MVYGAVLRSHENHVILLRYFPILSNNYAIIYSRYRIYHKTNIRADRKRINIVSNTCKLN